MAFGKIGSKLGLPGFNIPLHHALSQMEADRLMRTSGSSPFAYPVRIYNSIRTFFTESSWSFLLTCLLGFLLFLYLIDAIPSLFSLRWSQKPKFCELPTGIVRSMLHGSEGEIELLISSPPSSSSSSSSAPNQTGTASTAPVIPPSILFVHGGFGSASVWLPWMKKLHDSINNSTPYPGTIYAVSLRGHGGSFRPNYLEMTYLTSMTTFRADVALALKEISRLESSKKGTATTNAHASGLIIAAHSSGGGLIQHALASGRLPVRSLLKPIGGLVGLALIASIPPFGSAGVYWNWSLNDPWLWIRNYMHFNHPRSPLSSTRLVRRAFFVDGNGGRNNSSANQNPKQLSDKEVKEFASAMPAYESLIWPSQMMFGRYVDVDEVLARMTEDERRGKNILILAADADRLMRWPGGQRRMAIEYANILRAEDVSGEFEQGKKIDEEEETVRIIAQGTIAGEKSAAAGGGKFGSVQLSVIKGSGHHLQNDVKRDQALDIFRRWAERI